MFRYCDKHEGVVISWLVSRHPNGCSICHVQKLLDQEEQINRKLKAEIHELSRKLGPPGRFREADPMDLDREEGNIKLFNEKRRGRNE